MFQDWSQLLSWLVVIAMGFVGVPLTTFFKNKLGADGKAAVALTALVAGVLGVISMLLMGQLDPASVTPANFPAVFSGIFATSTLYYKLLISKPEPLPLPPDEGV